MITKLGFLIFASVFISSTTMIISLVPSLDSTSNPFDDITGLPDEDPSWWGSFLGFLGVEDTFIGEVSRFFKLLLDIMTFRIDGLPAFVSIVFITISVGAIYSLVGVIRGTGA